MYPVMIKDSEYMRIMQELAGRDFRTVEDYLLWCGHKVIEGGVKMSNVFKVQREIIFNLGPM